MCRPDLVTPVAHDEDDRQALDPTCEQTQDVQTRLVRTVHVVEDENRRLEGCRRELAHEARSHVVRLRVALDGRQEVSADRFGDVEERPEWARCEQWVAGAPQRRDRFLHGIEKTAQECGLSDPGFAVDEHKAPGSTLRNVEHLREEVEFGLALEELGGRACMRHAQRIMLLRADPRFKRR